MRRAALLLVSLLGARFARAEPDYAIDNTDWNGLSDLASIAEGRGLTVEASPALRWSDIGPADVLFLLYPTERVEPAFLAAFLRGGGHALIADDFGRADEALARLGILRRRLPRRAGLRLHNRNPNLPIATAHDSHPLARGVDALVTNHPAAFEVSPGPDVVFSYHGRDEAVVVAGQLGQGRFVALSDPSVLINDMLAFDGNLTFAVNLLDFLSRARPGRILIITGDAILVGQPPEVGADTRAGLSGNELFAELDRVLEELNDYLAPEMVLRFLGVTLGVVALALGVIVLPLRRMRDPDPAFARVPGEPPGPERLLRDLDRNDDNLSYGYPAAVLRENEEVDLAARVARGEHGAAQEALALIKRLPSRAHVVGPGMTVTRRAFLEAHAAVTAARRAR